MISVNSDRLLDNLNRLRRFGAFETGVIRPALSPADMLARNWLRDKMDEAGLDASIDGVGTVIGRSRKQGKALLIGSHTDSQPQGGWLDGALGVIYGIEVAHTFTEHRQTEDIAVDVASWSDEEGTYFSMLGSMSFCSTLDSEEMSRAVSYPGGKKLTDALQEAGIADSAPAKIDSSRYLAYMEAHIEQGPLLEQQSLQLGIVSGIVGIRTFKLEFFGEQNHAGSTPMKYRKDAAQALFSFAISIGQRFGGLAGEHTVWTIGDARTRPGSPNIIPGQAEMLLEFRDISEQRLDDMQDALGREVERFVNEMPISIVLTPYTPFQKSAVMHEHVMSAFSEAAEQHAPGRWIEMPSGAGHDAQTFAPLLPTGMLFIPSIGGISHNIDENSSESDIILGCQVMATAAHALFSRFGDGP